MAFNPWKCGKCLKSQIEDVQGHDPRSWIKDILWDMAKSGHISGSTFKKKLEKKIRKEIHDVSHPEQYCENMWNKIKHKCGT